MSHGGGDKVMGIIVPAIVQPYVLLCTDNVPVHATANTPTQRLSEVQLSLIKVYFSSQSLGSDQKYQGTSSA